METTLDLAGQVVLTAVEQTGVDIVAAELVVVGGVLSHSQWDTIARAKEEGVTHAGNHLAPPVTIKCYADPGKDVLGIINSANGVGFGLTSDRRLLDAWWVVSADALLDGLTDLLEHGVLAFEQVAELRSKLIENRTCSGIFLDESIVRGCGNQSVVLPSEVNQGFLEEHLGLDTESNVDPDYRTGRDGLEDVLALGKQVVLDDLCDHGHLKPQSACYSFIPASDLQHRASRKLRSDP